MTGVFNLFKPSGITSRGVVDRVQRLVRPAKAGHGGTLDPLACGVLVVCVGAATRLVEFLHELPKAYRATFLLGRTSTTEDVEGEVAELPAASVPTPEQLEAAARRLSGRILQRPPAFSALKVAGRRAYNLARQGQTPELAPREVTIHRLEIVRYDYPELVLDIECSGGTYVRSLGRDLAESVGSGAVMSALERTAIGHFKVEDAVTLEDLRAETLRQHLQPTLSAVAHLQRVTLSTDEAARIARGMTIAAVPKVPEGSVAAVDDAGNLLAVLARRADGTLRPIVNLPP